MSLISLRKLCASHDQMVQTRRDWLPSPLA